MSQTSHELENRTKCRAVQKKYKADTLFVHVFLALIYAVSFGMNSSSHQSEPNGSTCSQHGRCLSVSLLLAERFSSQKKCNMLFQNCIHIQQIKYRLLTLTRVTWRIWWAPTNASKWQMGFNLAFKGLIKLIKNKSRHNFINNLSSATCFTFVSYLQVEYTTGIWTTDYNVISGFDEISLYIIMKYYKK